MSDLIERLRNFDHDYHVPPDLLVEAAKRIEWLEGLFDFSDPEIVLHLGANDPVTKDAVVVLRSHYEKRRSDRPEQSGPAGQGGEPTGTPPTISHAT